MCLYYVSIIGQPIICSMGILDVGLPIADTSDCPEGVTVTVIGAANVPPAILTTTSINPDDSEPLNCPYVNSTMAPTN